MNFLEIRRRLLSANNDYNLINAEKLAELIISYKGKFTAEIVEVDGRRCIKYYNSTTHQKNLTACCQPFKEKTRYIFSFEARPSTIVPEDNQYSGNLMFGFKPSGTFTSTPYALSGKTTTDFTRVYTISGKDKTVTDIDLYYGSVHYWLIDLDTVCLYEYDKFLELGGTSIWEEK